MPQPTPDETPAGAAPAAGDSTPSTSPVIEIFFMGGSTTFGWYQRDAHTIPALAARELQRTLPTGTRLHATNFGVPGHTFTQEVIELMLELQAGARPELVVFYDGINDVMATVQNGAAGIPQNEANRVQDFERGRRMAEQDRRDRRGIGNDLRTLGRSVWAVVERLELVERIVGAAAPSPPADLVSADSAAADLARVYVENVRLVEALADRYGFTPIYVWQPALMSSGKKLTEYERWRIRPADQDPQIARIRDVHLAVPPLLRERVPPLVGERFVDATAIFDADTLEVFADLFGHTYERANPAVVGSFLPVLTEAAARRATADASR
jgi:hypothetical protein